ncbi:MAG: porin [Myxococcota bacterium]|jgi:hypothetical protein|nr:porin [Myxococcota bacterium]
MARFVHCLRHAAWLTAVLLFTPSLALAQEGDVEWASSQEKQPPLSFSVGQWNATLFGYVRSGLVWIGAEGDDSPAFIGANNGFAMLNARLGVNVKYQDSFEVVTSVDGAADVRSSVNDAVGEQKVVLKDAFGQYKLHDAFKVRLGQFKPPIEVEAMTSTARQLFIRNSVLSDGVRPGEGIERVGSEGFGPARQVGLSLLSDVIDFGPVGLTYALALTNGNAFSAARNDNNKLAYYGRLELHLRNQLLGKFENGSFLVLGGAVGHNERTVGTIPNQLGETDLTWEVDLQFAAYGIEALAQFLMNKRSFPDSGQSEQESMGAVAQLAYRLPFEHFRFQLAYRFSYLDPFVDDSDSPLVADDKLIYHTVGLGYLLEDLPIEVKLNYTATSEEGSAGIDNDIVEALAQFVW